VSRRAIKKARGAQVGGMLCATTGQAKLTASAATNVDMLDLSRLRSGLSTHLGGLSFKCQGVFPASAEWWHRGL